MHEVEDANIEDDEELELDFGEPDEGEDAVENLAARNLSPEQLETIIRSQAKDVIETVVWRVVPELASQLIEKEINRLLQERESKS